MEAGSPSGWKVLGRLSVKISEKLPFLFFRRSGENGQSTLRRAGGKAAPPLLPETIQYPLVSVRIDQNRVHQPVDLPLYRAISNIRGDVDRSFGHAYGFSRQVAQ